MATYKPVLHHRKKQDGTRLIMIRITIDRKTSYISTGYYVKEKDWNANKSEVRSTNDMHEVFNRSIAKKIKEAQLTENKAFISNTKITSSEITNSLKNPEGTITFHSLGEEHLKQLAHKTTTRTIQRYRDHLNRFTSLFPNITPGKISEQTIVSFEKKVAHNTSENTIHRGIGFLSGLYTLLQQKGTAPAGPNPFRSSSVKQVKAEKERLTIEEIDKIRLSENTPTIEISKHVFLLQYYLGGLRISDILTLKNKQIQEGRIRFTDMKTGKHQSHIITPRALEIINKYTDQSKPENYLLPLMRYPETHPKYLKQIEAKTSLVNKNLKTIAKKAEIKKRVTSHVARHTFADHLRQSSTDLYTISKALGHSSIKMTENYLESFDSASVDNAMNQLFKNDHKKTFKKI